MCAKVYQLGCYQHLGSMLSKTVMNHDSVTLTHFIISGETKCDKSHSTQPCCLCSLFASELILPSLHAHMITPLSLPLSHCLYEEKREKSGWGNN